MLLQKTGSRLKQLISHRRNNSCEESGDDAIDQEGFTERKFSTGSRRLSWLSQTPSSEFTVIRRASSSATARIRPLPAVSSTAYSSASSLCSCDCTANPGATEAPLSKSHSTPPSSEILYLNPLSSAKPSGDARTWGLIFSEPASRSPVPEPSNARTEKPSFANVRLSTFDLLEALSIDPIDEDKTPTQSTRTSSETSTEHVSPDVGKLIRETDEAFKAVGNALDDAKAATAQWHDTTESTHRPRATSNPLLLLKKSSRSPLSMSNASLARSVSVVKVKRKKPAKPMRNLLSRALDTATPAASNAFARYTWTDVTANVADVFNGNIFRTEVDEMLTPSRLQRIKEESRKAEERKASNQICRTSNTYKSTPPEPLRLQNSLSRIDAAQANEPPFPSPVLPPPATPPGSPRAATGKTRKFRRPHRPKPPDHNSMVIDDLIFPSPPRSTRSRSNSRVAVSLPTILEISPLAIPLRTSQAASKTSEVKIQPPQTYISLPSTSFTLTSPNFRHGLIRVEKILQFQPMSPEQQEETLDWTAFQMAISGTMDDICNDADDEWEMDEAEIDEILAWWHGFRFNGYGSLARDNPEEPASKETLTNKATNDHIWTDMPHGLRLASEPEMQYYSEDYGSEAPYPGEGEYYGNMMEALEQEVSPMKDDSDQRISVFGEDEVISPMSPMEEIELPQHSARGDQTPIPMGFNLGHDLGDFLNWETQHVQSMVTED